MTGFDSARHIFWTIEGADEQESSIAPWFDLSAFLSSGLVRLHGADDDWTATFRVANTSLQLVSVDTDVSTALVGASLRAPATLLGILNSASTPLTDQSGQFYTNQSGSVLDLNTIVATQAGGNDYIVAARDTGHFSVFDTSGGSASLVSQTPGNWSPGTVDLASLQTGGTTFVARTAQDGNGVDLLTLSSSGRLSLTDTVTADDGLWVSDVTTLATTHVGGTAFVLVGAASSGSLSVIKVDDAGATTVVDHVLDDLGTRFQNVQDIEVLEADGLSYVAVYGGDDGLTLFALMPNGQLLHKTDMADQTNIGLDNINGVSMALDGQTLTLFVTSETETGLTMLTYDTSGDAMLLGTGGHDTLLGTATADVLFDGAGRDVMTGGAGADVFVLSDDGQRDVVTDFQVGLDRFDLSGWTGLYSTDQITVTGTSTGARVTYGSEEIVITTSNNDSLTFDDFLQTDILGIARILPRPDPEPDPVQFIADVAGQNLSGNAFNNAMIGGIGNDTLSGMDGHDTLMGGDGRDRLIGGAGNDSIDGGASHDSLEGDAGADILRGGSGGDTLFGGTGHDRLYGDSSLDTLYGGDGDDRLIGGTGADELYGGSDDDTLYGDSSTDRLYGDDGRDELRGGTGADTLYGGNGNDSLLANTGVDTVFGGAGDDWISPGNGVDIVYGGDGNDHVIGRTGWDTIYGGQGDDSLFGSEGKDFIRGGDDDDYLSGGYGFDTLFGEDGNDRLFGNIGEDYLDGGRGNDQLYGATGDDHLRGGDGDDVLFGAQGVDTLDGGAGDDFLRGGTLSDLLIFEEGHDSDVVSGLEGQDRISLTVELTNQITNGDEVVDTYGRWSGSDYILDFGNGDRILFEDLNPDLNLGGMIRFD